MFRRHKGRLKLKEDRFEQSVLSVNMTQSTTLIQRQVYQCIKLMSFCYLILHILQKYKLTLQQHSLNVTRILENLKMVYTSN